MTMAISTPLGAISPAYGLPVSAPASAPTSVALPISSVTPGAIATQTASDTAPVVAVGPDFAALLAMNIGGALPNSMMADGVLPDGGDDIGPDAPEDDILPDGAPPEPLAMALLALNGVILPMPVLAPAPAQIQPLPASSTANGAAAAVTASPLPSPLPLPLPSPSPSPSTAGAIDLTLGGASPVGDELSRAASTIGAPGVLADAQSGGSAPAQPRFVLADVVLPSVMASAAPAVVAPTLTAPRTKLANGPATPDAILPSGAGVMVAAPDMSVGKAKPLAMMTALATATAASDAAAPGLAELTAPATGPGSSPLSMTIAGLAVGRADTAVASPAMTSSGVAVAQADIAQLPVERQLDLARHDRWVNDLARDIAASAGSSSNMTFRLDPPQLGRLAVTLQQGEAGLSVRLDAETAEATQIMTQAQPRLIEDLRQQGVRVADASIGTQTGQSQSQSQNQSQSHQQQSQPQGQNLAQANSGQQDQSRQQGRAFDLNGDLLPPQAEAKSDARDAAVHGRVA